MKENKSMALVSNLKIRIRAACYAMYGALIALPTTIHAATIETIFDNTVLILTGRVAKLIGIAIVVVLVYMCMIRQIFPKRNLTITLASIFVIFGSASLYRTLLY